MHPPPPPIPSPVRGFTIVVVSLHERAAQSSFQLIFEKKLIWNVHISMDFHSTVLHPQTMVVLHRGMFNSAHALSMRFQEKFS